MFYCLQEEDLLKTFNKQIEEDRRIVIARSNLNELYKVWTNICVLGCILFYLGSSSQWLGTSMCSFSRTYNCLCIVGCFCLLELSHLLSIFQVLEEHELSCTDLLHVNTDDVILTKQSKCLCEIMIYCSLILLMDKIRNDCSAHLVIDILVFEFNFCAFLQFYTREIWALDNIEIILWFLYVIANIILPPSRKE